MAAGASKPPPVLSKESAAQIRRIELRTRDLVESLFSGEYRSVFKGRGSDFAGLREYQPGDDIRAIDWNVTARRGAPFLREYIEDRQLNTLIIVDLSSSQLFGTGRATNRQIASEIAAVLALAAAANNDRVALLLVTDQVEAYVPAGSGRQHALRLVLKLFSFQPERSGTRLSAALAYATRVLHTHAMIFLISDFLTDDRADPDLADAARRCSMEHDLVPIRLVDPKGASLPDLGMLAVIDPETGARRLVNTGSSRVRAQYAKAQSDQHETMSVLLRGLRLDTVDLDTTQDFIPSLVAFFRRRERMSR